MVWRKGQSGNPKGRKSKQGLAKEIRKRNLIGPMVDFAVEVLTTTNGAYTVAQRFEALRWLADRGWGKAAQVVDIEASISISLEDAPDLSKLSDAEIDDLHELLNKASDPDGFNVIDVEPEYVAELAPAPVKAGLSLKQLIASAED